MTDGRGWWAAFFINATLLLALSGPLVLALQAWSWAGDGVWRSLPVRALPGSAYALWLLPESVVAAPLGLTLVALTAAWLVALFVWIVVADRRAA
jgi:hypothetical protein